MDIIRNESNSNDSGVVTHSPVTLTDDPNIVLDASEGNLFRVTIAGNRNLTTPINATDGQVISVEATQDVTGNRTLTLSPDWVFSTDAPGTLFALSSTPNSTTVFVARYRESFGKWMMLSLLKGF